MVVSIMSGPASVRSSSGSPHADGELTLLFALSQPGNDCEQATNSFLAICTLERLFWCSKPLLSFGALMRCDLRAGCPVRRSEPDSVSAGTKTQRRTAHDIRRRPRRTG